MKMRDCLLPALAAALTACGAPAPEPGAESAREAAPAAVDNGASMTDAAVERLAAAYAELGGLFERNPGEAMEWAREDIENLGDWEYRIVALDDAAPDALAAELNALGNERWEAFWVETSPAGVRVYLKRPSISYLSRVPLSTLARLLGAGAQ